MKHVNLLWVAVLLTGLVVGPGRAETNKMPAQRGDRVRSM